MESHDEVRHEIRSRTVAHMVEAVHATPMEREPFPHFVVHGLFPDDVYQEMMTLMPGDPFFEAFNYSDRPSAKKLKKRINPLNTPPWMGDRGRFQMTNESIDRLSGRQRSLWYAVRDSLGSPELKDAVFNKLRAGLEIRLGHIDDINELAGYPLPELFRERTGYAFKPHPDTAKKVITMQIALPSDNSQEPYGTQYYRRSMNPLHMFREPNGFEIVKQVPFLPNVAHTFVVINNRTLKSWHGRTKLDGQVGVRNSILNFWYDNVPDANQDLVEQYFAQPVAV